MKTIKNILYGNTAPESQILDLYLPDSDCFSVYVHIHGGGIENGDKSDADFIART